MDKGFVRMKSILLIAFVMLFAGCNSGGQDIDREDLKENDPVYFLGQVDALEAAVDEMALRKSDAFDLPAIKQEIALYRNAAENSALIDLLTLKKFQTYQRELLMQNPEFQFDDVLCRKTRDASMPANWVGNSEIPKTGYKNSVVSFAMSNTDELKTVYSPGSADGFVGDIVLHYDADRFLFSGISDKGNWEVFEYNLEQEKLRQVSTAKFDDVDNYNGVYLPDGKIIFCSTACMIGVPCVGGGNDVANLYVMDNEGNNVRQLTYEQDADWYPYVMNSGKVMYLRWEYTDNSHYFSRILMNMNPDGTEQKALYGSTSYWPNTMFYAKQLPEDENRFVAIVSGHHGTARAGELVLFDTSLGHREAEGAVMRLGAVNKKVRPVIKDELVDNIWPKYLHPYPVTDTTFLTASQSGPNEKWAIYLVDTFGNRTKIKEEAGWNLMEPVPVMKRKTPKKIAEKVDTSKEEATIYLQDIYTGEGLKHVPRGTVKQLRIFTYNYTLRDFGNHDKIGVESCWDGKIILGTVDVEPDGSAIFKVPCNLPISIQPLDKDGAALQLMRSWTTAMPGEFVSCIGCHEDPSEVPKSGETMASGKEPVALTPVFDQPAGIGFEAEVQPVLDQYCISCHDGSGSKPDFKDTKPGGWMGFSKSYHELHPYVRRPGPESDFNMLRPMEYHASTSELIQMLDAGHYGVELDPLSRRRIVRWIDMNVPYFPNYRAVFQSEEYNKLEAKAEEIRREYNSYVIDTGTNPKDVKRLETVESSSRFSESDFNVKELKKRLAFEENSEKVDFKLVEADNKISIQGGTAVMNLVKVSAGKNSLKSGKTVELKKALYIADTEVTNAFWNLYKPEHDSRYYDQQWKDHIGPGYPANRPNQPVIRINQIEAEMFCEWLSEQTGKKVRLLTEEEWMYACLSGSDSEYHYGRNANGFSSYENLADRKLVELAVSGVDPKPTTPTLYNDYVPREKLVNDGALVAVTVGSYKGNAFGLYDMHGNVAEWVSTAPGGKALAKGGSWRDRPFRAGASWQSVYEKYQKVYNVGLRFCIEE